MLTRSLHTSSTDHNSHTCSILSPAHRLSPANICSHEAQQCVPFVFHRSHFCSIFTFTKPSYASNFFLHPSHNNSICPIFGPSLLHNNAMNCKLARNIFLVYITFLAPVKLLIAGKPSQGDVSRGAEKQARAKTKLPFPGLFPHHHHPVSFNCQNRKTGQNRQKQAKTGRDS